MVRLRINVGRRHGVLPPQIIGLVNKSTNSGDIRLGRIDISPDSTDVQIESSMAERVERAITGVDYQGTTIRVERVNEQYAPSGKPYGSGKPNASGKPNRKGGRPDTRPRTYAGRSGGRK